MFKLLLLTTQRRDEVGGMEWSEIEPLYKRVWTIPREKAKNDRRHEVHLSELTIEIIRELPRMSRLVRLGIGNASVEQPGVQLVIARHPQPRREETLAHQPNIKQRLPWQLAQLGGVLPLATAPLLLIPGEVARDSGMISRTIPI